MAGDRVQVRYVEGGAEVRIGERLLQVQRRDSKTRSDTCPIELVSAALGSWIALTVAAVAANKGISPERIDVQVRRETEERQPWRSRFEVQVDLGEGLTRRERIILFNSARRCEVNKLLNGEITFDYQLRDLSSA